MVFGEPSAVPAPGTEGAGARPDGALGEVGWVAQVLVNTTTGRVVDGHLRVELARSRNEPDGARDVRRAERRGGAALAAMATAGKDALASFLASLMPADDVRRRCYGLEIDPGTAR
jgi:hypothetical protein